MTLDQHSSVPLYLQIKEILLARIKSGEYLNGDRLPSERKLATQFNVSRMTGRQALQALAKEGFISTHVGKGAFVSTPKINQELRMLSSFTEDMNDRGLAPKSRVLRAEVAEADVETAERLQVAMKSTIIILSRVRIAGEHPLALETTRLPYKLCPDLLEKYDFSSVSLYSVLRNDYNCRLAWADQIIETRLPDEYESNALGLDKKSPVLSFTRVTFDSDDNPIEFVSSVYRGDQYQFRVVLQYSEHLLR